MAQKRKEITKTTKINKKEEPKIDPRFSKKFDEEELDSRFNKNFKDDDDELEEFEEENDDEEIDNENEDILNKEEDDDDDDDDDDEDNDYDDGDFVDNGDEQEEEEQKEENDNDNKESKNVKEKKIIIKAMDEEKIKKLAMENERKGIIYLASIPPRMKPAKLKQLLLKNGRVNRMYLVRANVDRKNHRNDMFKEGWVEFADKAVARKTATILNNQPMGGKARDIHRDCLWNLRYLPKFKWHHLQDKLISQRMERDKKLKLEISQVRKQNMALLEQVEKSKHINQKLSNKNKAPKDRVVRTFKQRETHEDKSANLSSKVLNKMVQNKKQKTQ